MKDEYQEPLIVQRKIYNLLFSDTGMFMLKIGNNHYDIFHPEKDLQNVYKLDLKAECYSFLFNYLERLLGQVGIEW